MQTSYGLTVVTHLHIDPLVETQSNEIKRLLNGANNRLLIATEQQTINIRKWLLTRTVCVDYLKAVDMDCFCPQ